jgi:hypothetical protein
LFVIVLLAATVPWFAADCPSNYDALPGWLLYSLLGTVVLVILLELLIQGFWDGDKGMQKRE